MKNSSNRGVPWVAGAVLMAAYVGSYYSLVDIGLLTEKAPDGTVVLVPTPLCSIGEYGSVTRAIIAVFLPMHEFDKRFVRPGRWERIGSNVRFSAISD